MNKLSEIRDLINLLIVTVLFVGMISCSNSTPSNNKLGIDAVEVSPNQFKVLLENELVRVIEYSLEPGKKDNWHTHLRKTSYVLSGGKLKIVLENGEEFTVDEEKGKASWMSHVGKHYAENIGESTVRILLTEIK